MSSQWSWFVAIQAVKTFPFQSVTVSNILHPIYTTHYTQAVHER